MTESHKSKYAAKKEAGNQMYGPGCCAHSVTQPQLNAARARAKLANPQLLRNYVAPSINWSESDSE